MDILMLKREFSIPVTEGRYKVVKQFETESLTFYVGEEVKLINQTPYVRIYKTGDLFRYNNYLEVISFKNLKLLAAKT